MRYTPEIKGVRQRITDPESGLEWRYTGKADYPVIDVLSDVWVQHGPRIRSGYGGTFMIVPPRQEG